MLNEALKAAELLSTKGFELCVINMPWLNIIDPEWFENVISEVPDLYVIEDHARSGALGEFLITEMILRNLHLYHNVKIFSVVGFPACGSPSEALHYHGLDGESLAKQIYS